MSRRFGQRRSQYAPSPAPWPNGADGNYLLTTGGPSGLLTAGRSYNFQNFTIQSTNFLSVNFAGNGWMIIGVAGNLVIDGSILYGSIDNGVYSATAPDGTVLTNTFNDPGAGNGGDAGSSLGNVGGQGYYGFGGGGGGFYIGGSSLTNQGGTGGDGFGEDTPGTAPGGVGGLAYENNGQPGTDSSNGTGDNLTGAGGGGGAFGGNGGLIFFRVRGNISGSGIIQCSGGQGGQGGLGATVDATVGALIVGGGGGGGGGAGGSGGLVLIAYSGSNLNSYTMNVSGGSGGTGGLGGTAFSGSDENVDGSPGFNGTGGSNGSSNIYSV